MREQQGDYQPAEIEARWRETWEAEGLYRADVRPDKRKFYALTMLPYPSGNLHIGHWYAMAPSDARARFMRMQGYNVLFPMGFDAFGLPAENAAIKRRTHPWKWTYANIENMREQLKTMGTMIDWRREAISADPAYYHWTQWFFLKLLEHDLAYRKKAPVDWCPQCNTTLAREQVWGDDRHCERCHTPVIKKELAQWFFRTTRYADELLNFSKCDWPERVQALQTNWIGRSEGARVVFKTETGSPLEIFTTRPDTLWGATFMVLAPEHPLVAELTSPAQKAAIDEYVAQATRQTEIQRGATDKEKTGVFTGGYAINPVNGERIPVWIADYVLMGYGTGAIMAVPAHDQRDFEFARKYEIEIRVVIGPTEGEAPRAEDMAEAYPGDGVMLNSGPLSGASSDTAVDRTIAFLEEKGFGDRAVNYNLHDWLISRQRYWGAPIPMIYCESCGVKPVPENELPVELPEDIEWRPTGENPLKFHPTWSQTTCPACNGPAKRETDTMDTFMCSSWYHLRYLSPQYDQGPFDPKEYDYWMPVDLYTGGIEHATMHLIYTRFFHKAFRDMGIFKGDEPMLMLRNQGIILGEDAEKMSKSRGNVVDPDDLVREYGTDTVRAYLMFFARWEQGGPWNSAGISGVARWLRRVWAAFTEPHEAGDPSQDVLGAMRQKLHQTLKKVTRDLDRLQFNTCIAALMECFNELSKAREAGAGNTAAWDEVRSVYLRMLAPFTPHLAEELWRRGGETKSVHRQPWPEVDEEAAAAEVITLVVQVNGKVRHKMEAPADLSDDEAEAMALEADAVQRHLGGKKPRKVIVIKGRLVSIVV